MALAIVDWEHFTDGLPHDSRVLERAAQARSLRTLVIDSLGAGWTTPIAPDHFRSGCAPVEAIAVAETLLESGACDAVLIEGIDRLRTGMTPADRASKMDIYDLSIPEAYTLLAEEFLRQRGLARDEFLSFARELFENERVTAVARGLPIPPPRTEAVTSLFRAIDCANPSIDFEGRVLLARAERLGARAYIRGIGYENVTDGTDWIPRIARYDHLARAFASACAQAGIDGLRDLLDPAIALEAYTCFPIVPLAFLLATGAVPDLNEARRLVRTRPVTVTGGMNLARAPWNNPVLHALSVLCSEIERGRFRRGILHGNGGLGAKQGFLIVSRD